MTEIRFVTREIGSPAKPGWHVKAIATIGPVRRWRDLRDTITWYYEEYASISPWG